MSPAPRLKGYVCRMCGNESIQTPWGEEDFVCSQELGGCGATNKAPLVTLEEQAESLVGAMKKAGAAFVRLGELFS